MVPNEHQHNRWNKIVGFSLRALWINCLMFVNRCCYGLRASVSSFVRLPRVLIFFIMIEQHGLQKSNLVFFWSTHKEAVILYPLKDLSYYALLQLFRSGQFELKLKTFQTRDAYRSNEINVIIALDLSYTLWCNAAQTKSFFTKIS